MKSQLLDQISRNPDRAPICNQGRSIGLSKNTSGPFVWISNEVESAPFDRSGWETIPIFKLHMGRNEPHNAIGHAREDQGCSIAPHANCQSSRVLRELPGWQATLARGSPCWQSDMWIATQAIPYMLLPRGWTLWCPPQGRNPLGARTHILLTWPASQILQRAQPPLKIHSFGTLALFWSLKGPKTPWFRPFSFLNILFYIFKCLKFTFIFFLKMNLIN